MGIVLSQLIHTALLKPHWGASGTPFMKTTTFSLSTMACIIYIDHRCTVDYTNIKDYVITDGKVSAFTWILSAIVGAAQKVLAEKRCWFRGFIPILMNDLDAA